MAEQGKMVMPRKAGFDIFVSVLIALTYGVGAATLIPVLLGDFATYQYALGAAAGVAMLVMSLGLIIGCVAAIPIASTAKTTTALAGASATAGLCGLLCWALPGGSFPSEVLVPFGLYVAAAPIIVVASATATGDGAPRQLAIFSSAVAVVAMVIGAVLSIVLAGTAEATAWTLAVASVLLIVAAIPTGLSARRSSQAVHAVA